MSNEKLSERAELMKKTAKYDVWLRHSTGSVIALVVIPSVSDLKS